MNRRNFLAALVAAPWVVRSGVLMPVRQLVVPDEELLHIEESFDGPVRLLKGQLGIIERVTIRETYLVERVGSIAWINNGAPRLVMAEVEPPFCLRFAERSRRA